MKYVLHFIKYKQKTENTLIHYEIIELYNIKYFNNI